MPIYVLEVNFDNLLKIVKRFTSISLLFNCLLFSLCPLLNGLFVISLKFNLCVMIQLPGWPSPTCLQWQ